MNHYIEIIYMKYTKMKNIEQISIKNNIQACRYLSNNRPYHDSKHATVHFVPWSVHCPVHLTLKNVQPVLTR